MSFQAYLDSLETKTGKTPIEFIVIAKEKGFGPDAKADEIASWLKQDFDLGHGHAMAIVQVIKNGPTINNKHVGSTGTHRDDKDTLRLDGINKK